MKKTDVYLLYCNELDSYKIGVSKNAAARVKQLQTGCPYTIEIRHIFKSCFPYKVESFLHKELSHLKFDSEEINLFGEWFKLDYNFSKKFLDKCQKIENNIQHLVDSENFFINKK